MSTPVKRFELSGTYKIVNVKTKTIIDIKDGTPTATGQIYVGTQTQQWKPSTVDGVFWYIQNVASGQYLGLQVEDKAKSGFHVLGANHPFPWFLKRDEKNSQHIIFWVPYTNFVLDLDGYGNPAPGTKIQLWDNSNGEHQKWILSQDLESAVATALKDGTVYKIVNAQANTVVELNPQDRTASGFNYKQANTQHFEAKETTTGWAFKNTETGLYLGIPPEITAAVNNTRVVGTVKPFTWVIVADSQDATMFRLWIPHTGKLLNLYSGSATEGTAIQIWDTWNVKYQCWRFEYVRGPLKSRSTIYEQ